MQFDIVIVGAGLSGVTLAERYANVLGKKVLILENRNHIGGNCYDYINTDGILVPKYGPHFFHTNDLEVWQYISQFTDWHFYEHRVLSNLGNNTLVPIPVNAQTINLIFKKKLTSEEDVIAWLKRHQEFFPNPRNSEEASLAQVGKILYEKLFKNYTKKQWDMWPHELDPSVMNRIPVRTNFDDRYFNDTYQAMPKKGYTQIFEKMLDHPNITVELNRDFFAVRKELKGFEKLFYTGPIDQFFGYIIGEKLQYRSLYFEHETLDQEYFQERAQINYPNTELYTRITEPKHATGQKHSKTTIIREFSTWEGEPYYPVPSEKNQKLYQRYQQLAHTMEGEGIYFVGRLANYKYFNMDQAIRNALDLFSRLTIIP